MANRKVKNPTLPHKTREGWGTRFVQFSVGCGTSGTLGIFGIFGIAGMGGGAAVAVPLRISIVPCSLFNTIRDVPPFTLPVADVRLSPLSILSSLKSD